jgi:hypothetical protein
MMSVKTARLAILGTAAIVISVLAGPAMAKSMTKGAKDQANVSAAIVKSRDLKVLPKSSATFSVTRPIAASGSAAPTPPCRVRERIADLSGPVRWRAMS